MKTEKITKIILIISIILTASLTGCLRTESGEQHQDVKSLTVLTYDSFDSTGSIVTDFMNMTGYEVTVIRAGDAGGVLERALQMSGVESFDIILGLDSTYAPIALDNNLLMPHGVIPPNNISLLGSTIQDDRLMPYDQGFVCLNYDVQFLTENNLSVPNSLWDLTSAEWRGKVAIPSPETSSPGRMFLAATAGGDWGNDENRSWSDWWASMVSNELIITSGWSEAYEVRYSGGYGVYYDGFIGDAAVVLSYCHSPGAEAFWGGGVTNSVALDVPASSILQVEYVAISSDTSDNEGAKEFINHLLSESTQSTLPETNVMYPVIETLSVPEGPYANNSVIPSAPTVLSATQISESMDEWLTIWISSVSS